MHSSFNNIILNILFINIFSKIIKKVFPYILLLISSSVLIIDSNSFNNILFLSILNVNPFFIFCTLSSFINWFYTISSKKFKDIWFSFCSSIKSKKIKFVHLIFHLKLIHPLNDIHILKRKCFYLIYLFWIFIILL